MTNNVNDRQWEWYSITNVRQWQMTVNHGQQTNADDGHLRITDDGKWHIVREGIQWKMTDKSVWETISEGRQWGMTHNSECLTNRQWEITDNVEWHTMHAHNDRQWEW